MPRLRRALPALLVWAAGCEALVDGQLGDVHCVDEGWIGPPACPTGDTCSAGLCVPSPLGAACTTEADCASTDFCLPSGVFGAPGAVGSCSRPCCTAGDCDPDPAFVCAVAPGGGSSFCRPASATGLPTGGTLPAMAPCDGGGDCRSGRCLDHLCLDTCCSDTSCAVAADGDAAAGGGAADAGAPVVGVCRFEQPASDAPFGPWCAPPSGETPRYAACGADSACASGLCVPFAGLDMRCAAPCCDSADCEEIAPGYPVLCVTLPGADGRAVRACAAVGAPMGNAVVGDPCTTPADCRGGICLGHVCSDTCCSDASCGDTQSFGCRPTREGSAWALQCVLK